MSTPRAGFVDGLQRGPWSRSALQRLREAGLSAVHAPVACRGGFRAAVDRIIGWNARFRAHADLILPGRSAADLMRALASNRTAIVLGLQTPLPIEDDIGLLAVLHELGIRVMQLTHDTQSLLGGGWREADDGGLTRMGREVIGEMNRLGMLIDLSDAGERTALQAIEASKRPVAITHALPAAWSAGKPQGSAALLRALAQSGGMLGLSLDAGHLRDGSATTLEAFCEMAARTAEIVGPQRLGIGSGLRRDQPDDLPTVEPEGASTQAPAWFGGSTGFADLAGGLRQAGFAAADMEAVLGTNWQRFFRAAFRPAFEG